MAITEFVLYMDIIPYVLGTLIIIVGASKIKSSTPLHAAVVFTTIFFILAQSSWSSAWVCCSSFYYYLLYTRTVFLVLRLGVGERLGS